MRYAVIFGGVSYEHEISIVSAIALRDILPDTIFIFIDKKRDFYLIDSKEMKSSTFSSGRYEKMPKLTLKKQGFFQEGFLKSKRLDFDVAINLVHGGDGEDGKLAGMLEFFGIDFIGPRVEGSVIGFNKLFTKLYAKAVGCEVIEYQLLRSEDERKLTFDYPVIIKPLRLGSSIGVSVVRKPEDLDYALDVAFEFDDEVLVEPFIEGIKEYNLAGFKADSFVFSKLEEVQKSEFLDFDKKYRDFSKRSVEDADMPLKEKIKEEFTKIYDPLFLGALIRIDFFVHQDRVYINEINAVPGSLANYLFDDFAQKLDLLAKHLPKRGTIPIEYRYINSISAKK